MAWSLVDLACRLRLLALVVQLAFVHVQGEGISNYNSLRSKITKTHIDVALRNFINAMFLDFDALAQPVVERVFFSFIDTLA